LFVFVPFPEAIVLYRRPLITSLLSSDFPHQLFVVMTLQLYLFIASCGSVLLDARF